MTTSPKALEVRFSIEVRDATAAQLDAGRRFFGQLLAKARAEQTSARRLARERGQRVLPERPDASDPPHLLTGGSQTP